MPAAREDNPNLRALWHWGDRERHELQKTFRANLSELLATIEARMKGGVRIPPEELARLAEELQDAGETLREAMSNCFAAAGFAHLSAADTVEERRRRARSLSRLQAAVGKPVVLRRTSVAQLQGRHVLLEEIRGLKAIVRLGNDRWATPVDRVVPVDVVPEPAREERSASATAVGQRPFSPSETVTARIAPVQGAKPERGPRKVGEDGPTGGRR